MVAAYNRDFRSIFVLSVSILLISALTAILSLKNIKISYALLGAISFLILSYFRLYWALIIMIIYIPLQQVFPNIKIGTGVNIYNGLLASLTLGWVLYALRNRQNLIERSKFTRPIGFFIAASLFSLIIGSISSDSYNYLTAKFIELYQWLGVIALFFITLSVIKSKRQVYVILTIISFITLYAAADLIITHIRLDGSNYSHNLRIGGIFGAGGENDMGAFFAEYLFITFTLFFTSKRLIPKLTFLGIGALTLVALLFTYSRGAYIGAIFGLTLFSFLKGKRSIILILLFLTTIPFWAPESVKDRIEMTSDSEGGFEESTSSRIEFWKAGLQMFAGSPLYGVGYQRFPEELWKYMSDIGAAHTAHSMYVKIGAEMGLLGLSIFIWLLVVFIKEAIILYRAKSDQFSYNLALGFLSSMVALLVINIFGVRFVRLELTGIFWVYAALMVRMRSMTSMENN